jgi:hypothetical protein
MDILKHQFPIKSLIFLKSNCHAKMAPDSDPAPEIKRPKSVRNQDTFCNRSRRPSLDDFPLTQHLALAAMGEMSSEATHP